MSHPAIAWVRSLPPGIVSVRGRLALHQLSLYADDSGKGWWKHDVLAQHMGVSVGTARRSIEDLVKVQLIEIRAATGGRGVQVANRYRLRFECFPALESGPDLGSESYPRAVDNSPSRVINGDHPAGDPEEPRVINGDQPRVINSDHPYGSLLNTDAGARPSLINGDHPQGTSKEFASGSQSLAARDTPSARWRYLDERFLATWGLVWRTRSRYRRDAWLDVITPMHRNDFELALLRSTVRCGAPPAPYGFATYACEATDAPEATLDALTQRDPQELERGRAHLRAARAAIPTAPLTEDDSPCPSDHSASAP